MTTYARNRHQTHHEGPVAKTIEQQTKKMPSDWFLWAAFGSIALSLGLKLAQRDDDSDFVAAWAPTLLILGVYNKIVKVAGSEGRSTGSIKGRVFGRMVEGEEE